MEHRDSTDQLDSMAGINPVPAGARLDRESFARWLHAEYASRLLLIVRRWTDGDRYWAEDVVQETLLRAWRHAEALVQGESRSLLPWLTTVARRIVSNDRRSRRARPLEADGELLSLVAVPDDCEHALLRAVLTKAVANLSPAHRDVIVEVFLRGKSVQDVARSLGVPPGTVKSRTHYALRALRTALPHWE